MAGIHILIGEDDYLIGEIAKKTIGDGTGLELIDSINSTNEDAQLVDLRAADASFMTPPFLDPRKVTWWRNVHFLPHQGGKAVAEGVKTALEKFAAKLAKANLPENQSFILSGPKLLKSSLFAKTVKASCEVVELGGGSEWQMRNAAIGRVRDFAAEAGLMFAPGADEAFVDRVGCDTRSLLSEIGKMRDYLGEKNHTVTTREVLAVTSTGVGVEPKPWAITDALGDRNGEAMIRGVQAFANDSGFVILITSLAEKFFRDMAVLKEASDKGRLRDALSEYTPFQQKKYSRFLPKWSLRELRIGRARMLRLREKAVQTGVSADQLVSIELLRLVRK